MLWLLQAQQKTQCTHKQLGQLSSTTPCRALSSTWSFNGTPACKQLLAHCSDLHTAGEALQTIRYTFIYMNISSKDHKPVFSMLRYSIPVYQIYIPDFRKVSHISSIFEIFKMTFTIEDNCFVRCFITVVMQIHKTPQGMFLTVEGYWLTR